MYNIGVQTLVGIIISYLTLARSWILHSSDVWEGYKIPLYMYALGVYLLESMHWWWDHKMGGGS